MWRQSRYSGSVEGGATGPNADWDWWVADSAGWTGIRVQAKKIDPTTARYGDLNHDSRKKHTQAKRLIANAAKAHGAPTPAYCFFNAWFDPPPLAAGMMGGDPWRRSHGATIVHANEVLSALDQRLKAGAGKAFLAFDTFATRHVPLGRLFCTQPTARGSLATWAQSDQVAGGLHVLPTPEAPPMVQALLLTLSTNPNVSAMGRSRIADAAPFESDVSAVVVQVQDEQTLRDALASIS